MLADFDGDGRPDIAVANGVTVNVLLGNGDGTLQAPVAYQGGPDPQVALGLVVGDYNQDGMPDIAVAYAVHYIGFGIEPNPSSIRVLFGNGDGTFSNPTEVSDLGGSAIDLVAVSTGLYCGFSGGCSGTGPGQLILAFGNGDGTFRKPVAFNAIGNSLAIDDFNGDGRTDIAIAVAATGAKLVFYGYIKVLLGNGDGTLHSGGAATLSLGNALSSVSVADFTGDDKQDLAVVSARGVTVFDGTGDGSFPTTQEYDGNATLITSGEFTGDGRTDIAAASRDGRILVLRGTPASFPATAEAAKSPNP